MSQIRIIPASLPQFARSVAGLGSFLALSGFPWMKDVPDVGFIAPQPLAMAYWDFPALFTL